MAKKQVKRLSASLIIKKKQIKTIGKDTALYPRRWIQFKNINKVTSVGEDVVKLEPSHTAGKIVKCFSCYQKIAWQFLKKES